MQLNAETNVCECETGFAKQLYSNSTFACINAKTTPCESKTTLTLDKTACVFVYSGVCGPHAEVVSATADSEGPAGSRCACAAGWSLDKNSKCSACDSAAAFVAQNGECVCNPERFLAFSAEKGTCSLCVSADMVFDKDNLKCSCPAGTALGAAGTCSDCASGFVSAAGACLSGCYELGARFYYEKGASGSSDSASTGKVCLECEGVIQTDSEGFRTCVAVSECENAPVEVNGVMACLAAVPVVVRRMEYDSATGSLVEVLQNSGDSSKVVAAQVKNSAGDVFQLFSDKTQRLIPSDSSKSATNFSDKAVNIFVVPNGFGRVLTEFRQL